eukprot:scaffold23438_cov50-Attheya_sp.AAC.5
MSNPVQSPSMLFPMPSQKGDGAAADEKMTETVQWVGMKPLEMVEALASMTEQRMRLSTGRENEPLKIKTASLSTPSPHIPVTMNSFDHAFNNSRNTSQAKNLPGNKRSRDAIDDDMLIDIQTNRNIMIPPILNNQKATYVKEWDFSRIAAIDPNSKEVITATEAITNLVQEVKSTSTFSKIVPSFNRVAGHFFDTLQTVDHLSQCTMKKRSALDQLYKGTIDKLEALLKTCQDLEKEKQLPEPCGSMPSTIERGNTFDLAYTACDTRHDANSIIVKQERPKRSFAHHMSEWLKENWTNPYPDDEGLQELADACDTTTTIVGNWLINARTRKWRPAIIAAYEKGRPADLLKEDAIQIFDGKPLREIVAMTRI